MNRLLKTSSRTGSTVVPIAAPRLRAASTRSRTRWSSAVTRAGQPGSTIVVALLSTTIAGPAMIWPGRARRALDERGVVPAAVAEHAHASPPTGAGPAAASVVARSPRPRRRRRPPRPTPPRRSAGARASGRRSAAGTRPRTPACSAGLVGERHDERRVGALVAQVDAPMDDDPRRARTPCALELGDGVGGERLEPRADVVVGAGAAAARARPGASPSGRRGPCRRPTARRRADG